MWDKQRKLQSCSHGKNHIPYFSGMHLGKKVHVVKNPFLTPFGKCLSQLRPLILNSLLWISHAKRFHNLEHAIGSQQYVKWPMVFYEVQYSSRQQIYTNIPRLQRPELDSANFELVIHTTNIKEMWGIKRTSDRSARAEKKKMEYDRTSIEVALQYTERKFDKHIKFLHNCWMWARTVAFKEIRYLLLSWRALKEKRIWSKPILGLLHESLFLCTQEPNDNSTTIEKEGADHPVYDRCELGIKIILKNKKYKNFRILHNLKRVKSTVQGATQKVLKEMAKQSKGCVVCETL